MSNKCFIPDCVFSHVVPCEGSWTTCKGMYLAMFHCWLLTACPLGYNVLPFFVLMTIVGHRQSFRSHGAVAHVDVQGNVEYIHLQLTTARCNRMPMFWVTQQLMSVFETSLTGKRRAIAVLSMLRSLRAGDEFPKFFQFTFDASRAFQHISVRVFTLYACVCSSRAK